ncbi:MAG: drug/metabolite transporter (DMT)-like permease [Candidatus Saccharimonadales bacterium]
MLLAALIIVGLGLGDFANSRAAKKFRPLAMITMFGVVGTVFMLGVALATGMPTFSVGYMAGFMLASFFEVSGLLLMLKAFKLGKAGVITPITNSYILVAVFVLAVFAGKAISAALIAAVLVTLAGVITLTFEKTKSGKFKVDKSVILALVSILFFGMSFVVFEYAATGTWIANTLAHSITTIPVAAMFIAGSYLVGDPVKFNKAFFKDKIVYVGALSSMAGGIGLFISIEHFGSVVFGGAVDAASPLATALLAYKFNHDRLSRTQWIGAVVAVVGVMGVSIFS